MSDWSFYIDHPQHMHTLRYGLQGYTNDDHYPRMIRGSVGGNSPMFIHSDERSHIALTHGQNTRLPYRPGLKPRFR